MRPLALALASLAGGFSNAAGSLQRYHGRWVRMTRVHCDGSGECDRRRRPIVSGRLLTTRQMPERAA